MIKIKNISFPRGWILVIGLIGVIFLMIVGVKTFIWIITQKNDLSSATNLTPRNIDGRTGGLGTQKYNQMVEELDRNEAEKARESGDSFVATPVGQKVEVKKTEPMEKAKIVSIEFPPQKMAKPVEKREVKVAAPDNGHLQALLSDLKGLDPPGPGAFVVSKNQEERSEPTLISSDSLPKLNLPVGTILYAVTELAVDSRIKTPVVVRVVEGKLKGARFFGGFTQTEEILTLSFDRLVDTRLGNREITAMAVDPQTDSPAILGQVDRHLLARWGGLLASSFLEGFGAALGKRGTTVSVYGDVIVQGEDDASLGEISLEALGQVGSRAATRLEQNFEKPPTVIIPAGSPIGLLILDLKD
jgi:hypothetical protein